MDISLEAVLSSSVIFSRLTEEDLRIIASLSDFLEMKEGDTLFQKGHPSISLYIVVDGEILIRSAGEEQKDIARFLPGDIFGDFDLFTGEARGADAQAVGVTKLLEFPRKPHSFSEISNTWPVSSARLMHSFLIDISTRIRHANDLVKERSPLVRQLKKPAETDQLTGLLNNFCFEDTLEKVLKKHKSCGILMCKPDNFKKINDTYGHDMGDEVLKHIAQSLKQFVPDKTMLFRIAGNENAVIFPDANRDKLNKFALQLGDVYRTLDLSSLLKNDKFVLSVSIGLCLAPDHGTNPLSLIDIAHSLVMEGRSRKGNAVLFPEDADKQ